MPVIGPHIKITYRYTWLGQLCQNVQYWTTEGAAFLTATMDTLLEAYWNDLQPTLAPLMPVASSVGTFDSLLGEEVGGLLGFAEYPVPPAERVGTRAAINATSALASFNALGIRQTVGTRTTRPGQKRFPWLCDPDVIANAIDPDIITLYTPLAEHFSSPRALGAPVATGVLVPVIGGTQVAGVPTVWQDVTGFVINPDATSQISRKKGRGA